MPTLAGFTAFVRTAMGISTDVIPDDSVWLTYAFNVAMAIVNRALLAVGVGCAQNNTTIYALAVYNLAADNLVNYAQDQQDGPLFPEWVIVNGQSVQLPFMQGLRAKWSIGNFAAGVVASVSDVSTTTSLEMAEAFKTFTMANLNNLKTPYGRQYIAFALEYGQQWGLS